MSIVTIAKTASKVLVRNAPHILTSCGIVGGVGTVILGAKKIPEAKIEIEKKKAELGDECKTIDKVKAAAKPMAPVICLGGTSLGCVLGANVVSSKRLGSVTKAYKLTSKSLEEWKASAIESVGARGKEKLMDSISEKLIKDNPPKEDEIVRVDGIPEADKNLCLDAISGRYFESSAEKIRQAFNYIASDVIECDTVTLNDYYYHLELPPIELGQDLEWSLTSTGVPSTYFSSALKDDDRPCLVCHIDPMPVSKHTYIMSKKD